ncbi:MAG: hypothetical protein ORN28_08135 [Rhodoferax sp.]|nr:hypothetical protein [Rhodoferax sp.]
MPRGTQGAQTTKEMGERAAPLPQHATALAVTVALGELWLDYLEYLWVMLSG